MRRIAVMTSGGEAPGMNAAVRAVARSAAHRGIEVLGIRGYRGLLGGEMEPPAPDAVHDIIHRGGTVLLTARCAAFTAPEGQRAGVEGFVCVGGDGSLRGSLALERPGVPCIGIPAAIDNDLGGTEQSIGFDTAVNTAVQAADRVRDTAAARERTFVVEVMGRRSGLLALAVGMACGAETIPVPEVAWSPEAVRRRLRRGLSRGLRQNLIVLAEGAGRGTELGASTGVETRVTILGHVQRGGSPTAADRNLSSRLGAAAVDFLAEGHHGPVAGIQAGVVVGVPLRAAVAGRRTLDLRLHEMASRLSA